MSPLITRFRNMPRFPALMLPVMFASPATYRLVDGVVVVPMPTFPEMIPDPSTCSAVAGVVVPMPTLLPSTVITVVWLDVARIPLSADVALWPAPHV
jgi:hypothetical protein